ncbi:YkyA family protein [Bacillaceae bacterium Marseille-Q3522]|nr:YkyA family protein [Bacillaceae bacterium Marseille-Q3522]
MSGCFNQKSSEEKAYELLEKVVAEESEFEEQQDPLVELERKEKDLYNQIISLGMKEMEQVIKLSDEALDITTQRKELMDKEQESMEAAKKKFEKFADIITEFEDQAELQKKAKDLNQIMMDRYQTHDQIYSLYSEGLQYDQQLYEMFKQENVTIDQLEEQIEKINGVYEKVFQTNEKFNDLTNQYNETKLDFYKESGLKIKNEE